MITVYDYFQVGKIRFTVPAVCYIKIICCNRNEISQQYFSAKQLTPFISITYEQKMLGFMKESGLEEYCIDVNELNADILWKKFNHLVENYNEYVGKLKQLKTVLQIRRT